MMHHDVLGVRVDDLALGELTLTLTSWLDSESYHVIVTPNPEIVLAAKADAEFMQRLARADLALPDGVGLRFAIALLSGARLQHRHTGVDTLLLLAQLCQQGGKRLALFGGRPGFGYAEAAAGRLRRQFPGLDVVALDPGNVTTHTGDQAPHATTMLAVQHADVVAVALGQKKQEWFMEAMQSHVPGVKIAIGVGGAFEMLSGRLPRAPQWMRSFGFEWLWRVLIEPSRLPRTFRAAVVFPITVLWARMKHLL